MKKKIKKNLSSKLLLEYCVNLLTKKQKKRMFLII